MGAEVTTQPMPTTMEGLQRLIADTLTSVLTNRDEAEKRSASIMMPTDMTNRQRVIEIAQNGHNDDPKRKEVLINEYWRHRLLGPQYTFQCDVPLPMVQRALTTDGTNSGAELIATQYMREAIIALANEAAFRPWVRVLPMTENTLDFPIIRSGYRAVFRGENTPMTTSTMTTDHLVLVAKNLAAMTDPIGRELVSDSRVPILQTVAELISTARRLREQQVFCNGVDPTLTPYGIEYGAYGTVVQSGSAPTYDDIIKLIHRLPQQYRYEVGGRVAMFANNSVIERLRLIKDNDNRPILVEATAQKLTQVLGWTIIELPDISGDCTRANPSKLFFGNGYRGYYWGDREGETVESTTEALNNFNYHTLQIKLWCRVDGKPADTNAMVVLTGIYK